MARSSCISGLLCDVCSDVHCGVRGMIALAWLGMALTVIGGFAVGAWASDLAGWPAWTGYIAGVILFVCVLWSEFRARMPYE